MDRSRRHHRAGPWIMQALVVSVGVLLLAGCNRPEPSNGDSRLVAAAKAAVTRKLNTPETAEFRHVIEYSDGVVCGEVNAKKMYSGTDIGFRRFIYNAPEPEQLVLQNADLSRQDMSYWCSEQPDKRTRMLAASIAELKQECETKGAKSSDMSCRLAAAQKQALDALQASRTAAAPAAAPATASASQAATPAPAVVAAAAAPAPAVVPAPAVAAAPAVATPPAVPAAPAAATPTASPPPAPAAANEAAMVAEVGAALQTWRGHWQDGDVDGYLQMYAPSFTGDAGSRAEWEQQRRKKMKDARPSIRVENLEAVRVTPQEVELRFVQVYSARKHRDRGHKTMVFQRGPQGWRITDERWAPAS